MDIYGETILIADAGGTSTSWALLSSARPELTPCFRTEAINSALIGENELFVRLQPVLDELKGIRPDVVKFYGAGCATESICSRVSRVLSHTFLTPEEAISVKSDIFGAALALFGNTPGIACILGTGSASALWNGEKVVDSTPSLGYVLGDEGSGADMGKRLLNAYFKRRLSAEACECFRKEFGDLTIQDTIENIYRQPGANRWLASFAKFLKENQELHEFKQIAEESIEAFFDANLGSYRRNPEFSAEIGFVGSIASNFRIELEESAELRGLRLKNIVQSPIELLIDYHRKHISK